MAHRVGIFLVVIGILLLISFIVALQAGETVLLLGVGALFCLIIGGFLALRFRPGAEPTTRFRTFNKFRDMSSRRKK